MADNKRQQPDSTIIELLKNLKIKYLNGQNPMGRAQVSHGFNPAKNAALNLGRMMGAAYDPEMRIRPGDPQQELRALNSRIGMTERIHNTYIQPRVKLAD